MKLPITVGILFSLFTCNCFAAEIIHTTANLSQARWRLASAVVGTKALFAGGQGQMAGSYSNVVDIYDNATGLWTKATLSQARCDLTAVTVGTKVLFAGGYYGNYQWSNVIDIYDSVTNTWSTAKMPLAAHNYCAFSFGNKAFFASGTASNDKAHIYDLQSNTWQTVELSAGRYNIAATKTSDTGFFAAGNEGGINYNNVDIYNSLTDTWSVGYLSSGRIFISATTIGSKAIFAGGCTSGPVCTVDIYDTDTNTWTVTDMPGALGEPEATSVGNFAFFAGCWSSRAVYVYDISNTSWQTFTLSGGYRYSLTAVSVGNQALFAGGGDYNPYYSTVDIFTVVQGQVGPVACIGDVNQFVEAQGAFGARVTLDGSCSSDADSTEGTNDDINDFDWYRFDPCDQSEIYIGSGEIIEYNLPIGENVIILEVTDKSGLADSNEVTITVADTTSPEFEMTVTPAVLWPPNGKMIKITPSYTMSDLCDEQPEISIVEITMNEAGSSNDIKIGDDGSIYLCAKRIGNSIDRIYTVTCQACDDYGNCTVKSATVIVPHNNRGSK